MQGCRLVVETKGNLLKLIENLENNLPENLEQASLKIELQSESQYATIFFAYQPMKLFDLFPLTENNLENCETRFHD